MVDLVDFIFDAYQIKDVLKFVFDSSNPSFATLSTTRAFSLLRRELAWITILQALTRGDLENLEDSWQKVAILDPNAGQWLLERLHETFGSKERYTGLLARLYTSTTIGSYSLEVETIAISNLASYLQAALESKDTAPQLPLEDLAAQVKIISTSKGYNRDKGDADLHLEGCLIGLKSITEDHQPSELEIREWAIRLMSAVGEETVRLIPTSNQQES